MKPPSGQHPGFSKSWLAFYKTVFTELQCSSVFTELQQTWKKVASMLLSNHSMLRPVCLSVFRLAAQHLPAGYCVPVGDVSAPLCLSSDLMHRPQKVQGCLRGLPAPNAIQSSLLGAFDHGIHTWSLQLGFFLSCLDLSKLQPFYSSSVDPVSQHLCLW